MSNNTSDTIKELKAQLRDTKREMKAKGIRRISCFNGGLHGEVYALNARCFALETRIESAQILSRPGIVESLTSAINNL